MSEEDTVQDSNDQSQQNQNAQGPVDNEKVFAVLGYLTGGLLFFLPLVTSEKPSHYAKVHANNQLILLLGYMIGNTVLSIIVLVGWILMPFFNLALFILTVIGLVHVIQDKANPLPVIGKWKLIK